MSATGNPAQIVWVFRKDPNDESSLLVTEIEGHQLGVFIFTRLEYAREFDTSCSKNLDAIIAPLEVSKLAVVLSQQIPKGAEFVVTDPKFCEGGYRDQQTLTIGNYIARLETREK